MFIDYGSNTHTITLVIHIISIISWMAGMLYLPRLFAYHCTIKAENSTYSMFCTMEKRLFRVIIMPASLLSAITGLLLAGIYDFHGYWVHTKLLFASFLFALQYLFGKRHNMFMKNKNSWTEKRYKVINELVTICMIVIVVAAVTKFSFN